MVSLLNDYDYHRSFLTLLPLEDYTPDSNTTTFQLQSTDSQYLLTDKAVFFPRSRFPAENPSSTQ